MPLDLQSLSPKPDFEALESAPTRIPKLAVRGRPEVDSPTVASVTPSSPTSKDWLNEKDKSLFDEKESVNSSDDSTLPPPSSDSQSGAIAPWETATKKEHKYEPRGPTTIPSRSPADPDGSFTTDTNNRHSSETARQPFRHEVYSGYVLK